MPFELAFWTPENDDAPGYAEETFKRLKAGETVDGLKPISVDTVLKAIADTYPELEINGGYRLVFKNGSIDIAWSGQHFLFTSRGNLPQRARHGLTAILFYAGCWMYEEPCGMCWNTQELAFVVMHSGKHGELPRPVNELLSELTVNLGGTVSPPPGELVLSPAGLEDYEPAGLFPGHLKDRAAQCEQCGYTLIGDFLAEAQDVVFRAWYGKPNIFVCSYVQRLMALSWEEIIVVNADDTLESWCNWQVDELKAPWVTRVVQSGPLLDLHQLMLTGRSGKAPAKLKAKDFVATIGSFYQREQVWRQAQ